MAYSLYKRTINERKLSGLSVLPQADRDPQGHEIELHRTQAENYLRAFALTAIDAERATIIADSTDAAADRIKQAIAVATSDVISAVRERTKFWPNVMVGIVAWLISIAVTLLIAFSLPDWIKSLLQHVGAK